jgi:acyl dehydratase
MLTVETPEELSRYVGKPLGVSDWVLVDQQMIDTFAEATGDKNWYHIDVERAKREMPGGKTIAHGYLTLSLLARMSQSIYAIRRRSRGVNYGTNRVRFLAPVPSGARIRLRQALNAAKPVDGGMRFTFDCTVELEGNERPAMIAETILLVAGA